MYMITSENIHTGTNNYSYSYIYLQCLQVMQGSSVLLVVQVYMAWLHISGSCMPYTSEEGIAPVYNAGIPNILHMREKMMQIEPKVRDCVITSPCIAKSYPVSRKTTSRDQDGGH